MFSLKVKIFQIVKHGIISSICASTEFMLFILFFDYLKFTLWLSYIFPFCISTSIGFIGHSLFTFKVGLLRRNALFFLSQAFLSLIIGYSVIAALLKVGVGSVPSKIIQLSLVFFFNINYGRLLSFKGIERKTGGL